MSDWRFWFGDNWMAWIVATCYWSVPGLGLAWLLWKSPRFFRFLGFWLVGNFTARAAWVLSERK